MATGGIRWFFIFPEPNKLARNEKNVLYFVVLTTRSINRRQAEAGDA